MENHDPMRQRMRARDGSTFRVEKRSEQLFVNDMPAQIHALKGGGRSGIDDRSQKRENVWS